MELFIAVAAAEPEDTHLEDFVVALKKVGFNLVKTRAIGAVAGYKCDTWNLDKLKSAMKSAGWESQGKGLFPSEEDAYFVQKKDCEELCVFELDGTGGFTLEFSGY